MKKDPQGRGIGLLLVEAAQEEEGGEGRGECGRGCVEQRKQWEGLLPQPGREIETRQTNRGVGGVCVGVSPRVQSKLSRALHVNRGKKLLQVLQNLKSTAMKRAMVRFRKAREKGAMTFVECLETSKKTRWRDPCGGTPYVGVWGHIMRRNVLVGCVMAMVAGKKPSAFAPYLAQRRDGALSPTTGCSIRRWLDFFAREKFSLLLKIRGPSEKS